jgi:iduronate 2-sulfatase
LPDGATATEAVRRLREFKQTGQPFFLAVGFVKPHLPFIAPQKYWDLYDPDRIPGPAIDHLPEGAPEFAGHASGELHSYRDVPKGNPIPEDLARQLRHGYYACISYVDAQVGRLLDALDQEDLADNTVIVLWGDHGWQLGDHGIWAKHTNYELATRVPLILAVPGQQTSGAVSHSLVELVDLYPTLTAAGGLETPQELDGLSLMPLLNNPSSSIRSVALSQYPRGGGSAGYGPLMGYSVRDDRWRLTVWKDRRAGVTVAIELYDEQNDSAETMNVAEANPEVVARLGKMLPPLPKFELRRQTAAPQGAPARNRAALFAAKDRNQDDFLNLDEFTLYQNDSEAARKRFENWDADRDGVLSDEEFITQGGRTRNQDL